MTQPTITLSSLDYDRISALLERLPKPWSREATALATELERAELVEPTQMPPNRVTMNSRVRFRLLNNNEERELILSYPRDCGSDASRVSVLAPIGSALLGLAIGQQIEWPLANGRTTQLEILAIDYQPERAGDLHR